MINIMRVEKLSLLVLMSPVFLIAQPGLDIELTSPLLSPPPETVTVDVFHFAQRSHLHFIDSEFIGPVTGCNHHRNMQCTFYFSSDLDDLSNQFALRQASLRSSSTFDNKSYSSLALYNIHSLWTATKNYFPPCPVLPTLLTMAESEESYGGYGSHLFSRAFPQFDATSTTNSLATVK